MTRRPPLALAALALAAVALVAPAPPLLAHDGAHPEPAAAAAPAGTDTAALLAHLERTRGLFLAAIDGLSAEQWSWKPAPDRWSVGECAEHITRTERFLREILVEKVKPTTDAELLAKANGKSDQVLGMIVDRSQRFKAPEPVNPASDAQIRSREAILRDFNFERGRTVQHVSTAGEPTAAAAVHGAFQELDLAGWIYFQSGHTERHTLQIEEVKATPGFPVR
jgi:hypothetical protein